MKIAHISDIHTVEPHFLPDLLERVIKEINEIEPEIVVVTGDLTENGYPFEFKRAESYIEMIECKVKVVIPGNHDARNVGDLCFEEIFGPRSKVERYGRITIVGVDSTQPDLDDGHVGREKYGWIEKCLDTSDFKVVALHHHLISVPKTGRERNILIDAGDVLDLLIRCGTDLVLCGHKHVPWIWNLNGMIITNTGTACTNRVKWNIPQSFNLIEIDEEEKGTIKIYRMYSRGGQELVLEKRREKAMRWAL
ncbi:MAG: metallophosphoesterase [Methanomicrobia archaeon]|nr:metallophosphoesterase [Methanomicrobia archaeon]